MELFKKKNIILKTTKNRKKYLCNVPLDKINVFC